MKNGDDEDELKSYVDFLCWLRDFCFQNLVQYANFSRRITALRILEYLFVDCYLTNDNDGIYLGIK